MELKVNSIEEHSQNRPVLIVPFMELKAAEQRLLEKERKS